mgnify:CR=1 FL=1
MSKTKYKKGERITSLDEFIQQEFVYFPYGIRHSGYAQSQQIRFVNNMIKSGRLYKAIKISEQ